MTERSEQSDPEETPEDVASLYSWANLHGAKYRDFSASRAQTREKARQRVEQAIEEERMRVRQEAEAQRAAEALRAQEDARRAELAAQQAQAVQQAAYEAQQELSRRMAQQAAQDTSLTSPLAQTGWQPPRSDRFSVPSSPAFEQQPAPVNRNVPPPAPSYRQPAAPASHPPMREESSTPPAPAWSNPAPREPYGRPAWLSPEQTEPASQPKPPVPDDTLQGSRERLATRWYALQAVYDGGTQPAQAAPAAPAPARPPMMAVFSLAGGVGKTSLVATLGRALSARGERVLLVDTAAYGLMPFFFGARDQRPGLLRTFSPPIASGDAPIQMITLDPDGLGPETQPQEPLTTEITTHARGVGRVIIDLATASGAITRRVLRLAPQILVPLVPDMSSVVSVSSIDAFFQRNGNGSGKPSMPYYVLNQYDSSLPLHLDVREVLREQLGDRLLPFTLRHAPSVSEALAEGMTVMDYAPNSGIAEDYVNLAAWVKSLSAPAMTGFRGVRWSER